MGACSRVWVWPFCLFLSTAAYYTIAICLWKKLLNPLLIITDLTIITATFTKSTEAYKTVQSTENIEGEFKI